MSDKFQEASANAREILMSRIKKLEAAVLKMTSGTKDAYKGNVEAAEEVERLFRYVMGPLMILEASVKNTPLEEAVKKLTDRIFKMIVEESMEAYKMTMVASASGMFMCPDSDNGEKKDDAPPSAVQEINQS